MRYNGGIEDAEFPKRMTGLLKWVGVLMIAYACIDYLLRFIPHTMSLSDAGDYTTVLRLHGAVAFIMLVFGIVVMILSHAIERVIRAANHEIQWISRDITRMKEEVKLLKHETKRLKDELAAVRDAPDTLG